MNKSVKLTDQEMADSLGLSLDELSSYRAAIAHDARYQDPRILEFGIGLLEHNNARLKHIRPLKLKLSAIKKKGQTP